MTTYRISAPDGKTYQIEGPEGATQDQVKAEVMRQNPQLSGAAPAPAPARGTAMGESYTNPFGAATAGNPLMALAGAYLKPAIEAAPSSAGGLSRGFMEMIASPVQTASGLLDVAAGVHPQVHAVAVRRVDHPLVVGLVELAEDRGREELARLRAEVVGRPDAVALLVAGGAFDDAGHEAS